MKMEDLMISIIMCLLILFVMIIVRGCWSESVANSDIYSHNYIVIAGEYYDTNEIDYIDSDTLWHDKNVITIHFKNGVTYQTQEGQYVFAETKPVEVTTLNVENTTEN